MLTLKQIRISKRLTQEQAAKLLKVSLRSYKTYENDPDKQDSFKYKYMLDTLNDYIILDENHGILSIDEITEICRKVFSDYPVHYAYLFGSYSTNKQTEKSDVDILVASDIMGIDFFGLIEELRTSLNKRVDVLDLNQLNNNLSLTNEILRDGIKIYQHR